MHTCACQERMYGIRWLLQCAHGECWHIRGYAQVCVPGPGNSHVIKETGHNPKPFVDFGRSNSVLKTQETVKVSVVDSSLSCPAAFETM